ncbi:LLM class flavin-dependent oxidoreductase [Sphingobium sp.]|uniref:LLM class flavin-dependent oxidoreductase n=1 Tax=Sphingobium sp. TaxID=1912891 RepID=UPI0028BD5BA9|nr:LLM class flavin-dependent oxidoreductase [Sphingobium sp.]
MSETRPLKFGAFISPIHSSHEDANRALHRDVELVQWMEEIGFDEAWIGEHHSTGWEYVASPEVFLGYAAAKTSRIRLGTGVVSLPYHHPFNVAERLVLLDHLTRGRVMLGMGPGALPYDAYMYGLESTDLRPMMERSLAAIIPLLRGETVTMKTPHWELREARLQLLPYTQPCFELAVTSMVSPSGAKLAGRYGASMLSLNAGHSATRNALESNWEICQNEAAKHDQSSRRDDWRLVSPMHIAETRDQARKEVRDGLARWVYYNTRIGGLDVVPESAKNADDYIDALTESGFAVIGTPDDAIAQIEKLRDASGGFGTFLLWANDWANREATMRSYNLIATEVAPRYRGYSAAIRTSEEVALKQFSILGDQTKIAIGKATEDYYAEREKDVPGGGVTN